MRTVLDSECGGNSGQADTSWPRFSGLECGCGLKVFDCFWMTSGIFCQTPISSRNTSALFRFHFRLHKVIHGCASRLSGLITNCGVCVSVCTRASARERLLRNHSCIWSKYSSHLGINQQSRLGQALLETSLDVSAAGHRLPSSLASPPLLHYTCVLLRGCLRRIFIRFKLAWKPIKLELNGAFAIRLGMFISCPFKHLLSSENRFVIK